MTITHIFFDIGGVLGTGGWDTDQRELACEHFGLDPADFAERHQEAVGRFEEGRMTLDEYLDVSSCWLGVAKPARRIYEVALSIAQANPEHSVFIDDREQNLPPARALGMRTVPLCGSSAADRGFGGARDSHR